MKKSGLEKYDVVIGLEVHVQLLTASKIYSTESAVYGSPPNTHVSVVSLGHPGTMPILNKKVVEFAMRMGLACHSDITRLQIFDRKNYFYPDLPKGYQITQARTPICTNGFITIFANGRTRNIRLEKIHVEEDAGKSVHRAAAAETFVDFNRAGVALIEIVTKPEISSADEASAFLNEVRKLVRYLDISDGNMEEGSLRCDANVSVKLQGSDTLGKKVEIKNLNSMRNLHHAISYEAGRQIELLESGERILPETRTFHAEDGKTTAMRVKEELNDYRYFPDPDLSPVQISDQWLEEIRKDMPTLPYQLNHKFVTRYKLSDSDARMLTETKDLAIYFEEICELTTHYKAVVNWIRGPVKSYLNEKSVSVGHFPILPAALAELIHMIETGKLSFSVAAQKIFPAMIASPGQSAEQIAKELNLFQDSNSESILKIIKDVIKEFPLKVEEFKNGKNGIVDMFMGEVMKRSKGKADPKITNELLLQKLNEND